MHEAQRLKFHAFGQGDPLESLGRTSQIDYLRCYLADLGATSVVEEPAYFDRDYLAEYTAFYGISARGYGNLCRRLHFFAGTRVSHKRLQGALGGSKRIRKSLQENYLGFAIIRPIPAAPLGRTVLRWYPDEMPDTPRVTAPSRDYVAHLGGLALKVHGLAWQQQDSAVGACATIGLWTMLHSSAIDDHHAIPTTAEIIRSAHRTASLGCRVFPSRGLLIEQLTEAIKEQGLAPLLNEGDVQAQGRTLGFSRERFSSTCAAYLRSGYPVLLLGQLEGVGLHAVCAVGFRESPPCPVSPGSVGFQDSTVRHIYIHDDNLGPRVRFSISDRDIQVAPSETKSVVQLTIDPPPPRASPVVPNPTDGCSAFIPARFVVAAHDDLRTSPDALLKAGLGRTNELSALLNRALQDRGSPGLGLTFSARFIKLPDYLGSELPRVLGSLGPVLASTRLDLLERVPPMSLHLGVIRIAFDDATPLADILYDTTDSDRNHPVLATICFHGYVRHLVETVQSYLQRDFGVLVDAYHQTNR